MLKPRLIQWGLAVLLGVLATAALLLWQIDKDVDRREALRAEALANPSAEFRPTFRLINHMGQNVTEADYSGRYKLVFFGFTYCPDICPTGLQVMALTLDALKEKAAAVQSVFITIDPARDTPAVLKDYINLFDSRIVGLTGSADAIKEAAASFKVYYAKGLQVDGQNYMMDHSSQIFLLGPENQFITTFGQQATAEDIVAALSPLLAKDLK
jgi:protein SCO2